MHNQGPYWGDWEHWQVQEAMINLRKEVTWQVWPMVLLPKIKGGICVLNLILQNEALLLKQLHHFYRKMDVPWVWLIWSGNCRNRIPHATRGRILVEEEHFSAKHNAQLECVQGRSMVWQYSSSSIPQTIFFCSQDKHPSNKSWSQKA
jgi:hypothetical protein